MLNDRYRENNWTSELDLPTSSLGPMLAADLEVPCSVSTVLPMLCDTLGGECENLLMTGEERRVS